MSISSSAPRERYERDGCQRRFLDGLLIMTFLARLTDKRLGDAAIAYARTHSVDDGSEHFIHMKILSAWHISGTPVFHLEGDLAEALALTDYDNISADEFRPPFSGFAVKAPRPFGRIRNSAGGSGKYQDCREFLVGTFSNPKSESGTTIVINCLPEHEGASDLFSSLHLPRGVFSGWGDGLDPYEDEEDNALIKSAMRVVPSLCFYLAEQRTTDKPPRSPHPRRRPWRGFFVGSEIRLPQIRRLSDKPRTGEPLYKLKSKFIVRGHWRNQPCGKGRSETRRIWVRPFWKGEGETLTRIYSVGST